MTTWLGDFARDMTAGAMSAAMSKTIVAPLERIKIVLQVQATHRDIPSHARYKGVSDALVRMVREQGVLSMWRGNLANVARYIPTQASNFAFKDYYRKLFAPSGVDGEPPSRMQLLAANMASGGLAGATSLLWVYPLDLVRTRLTSDVTAKGKPIRHKGMWACAVFTYRDGGGLRALYKGFDVGLLGIMPYRAVYFGCFDTLKDVVAPPDASNRLFRMWMLSQTITVIAQFAAYPCDTVRRRMQLRGGGSDSLFSSSWACARHIWMEEGARGFFHGAWANTLRATGGALTLIFYEALQESASTMKGP